MKNFRRAIALLLTAVSLLLCACGSTNTTEPTPEPTAEPLAFSDDPNAITEASANVVMLTTYDKNGEIYMTGSGFPAFEDGYIVTNYHVIEGADRIEGNTESEMYFKIDEIVAADTDRDIAILKTNAKTGLTPLTLGDTAALQKGEKVVAIGSPLGLINTVSDGMYSNRRTEDGQEYLQFTAAISPGSSGGALFNDKGEVIGITSASYTEGQNLNLAIPSEVVQDVWNNKEKYEFTDNQELIVYTPSYIKSNETRFVNMEKFYLIGCSRLLCNRLLESTGETIQYTQYQIFDGYDLKYIYEPYKVENFIGNCVIVEDIVPNNEGIETGAFVLVHCFYLDGELKTDCVEYPDDLPQNGFVTCNGKTYEVVD